MKDKLAIFDLDGTLFDTRRVNYYAYNKALSKYDVHLDYDYFARCCNGRHYTDFLPSILPDIFHMEEVHKLKKEFYKEYLNEAVVNSHLFNIIEYIRIEYFIALVTTASRTNCEDILNYYNKLEKFDCIISAEDVNNKKPDPEGFIKAMRYYDMEAKNTVIFEDSDVGLQAAEKSGATVIAVKGFA